MTPTFSPTAGRLRTGALLAFSPALRAWIARAGDARRLAGIGRLVPGPLLQIPEELVGFAQLAAPREPATICEIGTWNGGTSLFLCGLSSSVRTFVGIDINPCNERLISALAPRQVDLTFVQGSSREPATRRRLTDVLGGSPLDLLFIDGDHRYEGVRGDLVDYRGLVRPGGLIAFHDIVSDRGRGLGREGVWSGGVPDLWQEIRDRFRHWELVRDWAQEGFGIGVIEHDPGVTL